MKKIVTVLVIVVLIAGAVALVKKRKAEVENLPVPERPVYVVDSATIKRGSLKVERNFIGKVVPDKKVVVSTKVSGYIEKIYITEGKKVKRGELLVKIDDTAIKTSIQSLKVSIDTLLKKLEALNVQKEALKVALETAEKKFKRDKKLFENKAISKQMLEVSQTDYYKAVANYNQLLATIQEVKNQIKQLKDQIKAKENELNYTNIKSPIDGVVISVMLKEGNVALPGKPIATVEGNNYKVVFSFPEDTGIKEESPVVISLGNKKIKSKVSKIYPSADKNWLSVAEVELGKLTDGIKSNSLVNVKVILAQKKGFIVPKNAVLSLTDGKYLLTVKNGRFVKVPVKVVAVGEENVLVEGKHIKEGMKVAVAQESKLRLLSLGVNGKLK